jgi:hypothetical protein
VWIYVTEKIQEHFRKRSPRIHLYDESTSLESVFFDSCVYQLRWRLDLLRGTYRTPRTLTSHREWRQRSPSAPSAVGGSPWPSCAQAGQSGLRDGRSDGVSSPLRPSYCHCREPLRPPL